MNFCKMCGSKIENKSNFCSKCGYKVQLVINNVNNETDSSKQKRRGSVYAITSVILVIISILSFLSGNLLINYSVSIKTVGFPQQTDHIIYMGLGMLVLYLYFGTMIASLIFSIFSYKIEKNKLAKYTIIINLSIIIFIIGALIFEAIFK